MAQVPYQSDAPPTTVNPEVATPDDYQHVQASPAAFGALLAQGAQEAGAGASRAAQFFGQVNADQVSNNFQSQASTIVENYKKLQGQDALNAQPQVTSDLDNLLKNSREQLNTPEEQLQFDNFSRRYRTYLNSDIGQHYDQQFLVHATSVNSTSESLALRDAATAADANNPDGLAHATSDLVNARIKQLQVRGEDNDQSRLMAVGGAKQDVLKVQLATVGATDPNRALSILQKNQTIAGTEYGQLYDELKAKADRQFGISKSTEILGQAATGAAPAATAQPPGPVTDDAASMIRGKEGFRPNAYYDRTAWRTGYGSDTVTLPDGTVQPVTAMTQVTQADAERDLQRRVQQTQTGIQGEIGPQAWNGLAPNVKASLTSVAYNYGHLPGSVAAAVRTGDPGNIAEAIVQLGSDNGGVNRARRLSEAENVLGKFGVSGVEATTGAAPLVRLPAEAQGAPPSPLQPDLESTAAPLPSVPQPPVAQVAPPSLKADVYSRILADPDLKDRPEAQAAALEHASQQINAQQIAEAQNEKNRKDASDKAFGGYVTSALQPNADWAAIREKVNNDPNLLPETKWNFSRALEKGADVGVEEATKTYGPGFWKLKNRLNLPLGDPNRISDSQELLSHAGPGGDLTLAGVDKLSSYVRANTRSVDDANVNRSIMSLEHYARSNLTFDQEELAAGIKLADPKGEAIFEGQFLPAYEHAVDSWVKAGKDPWDPKGPMSKEFVDKMIAPMRSKNDMAMARLTAEGQAVPGANIAPPDVNATGWQAITAKPPISPDGAPWALNNWAGALNYLRANPTPENKAAFDLKFKNAGYTADQVLNELKQ